MTLHSSRLATALVSLLTIFGVAAMPLAAQNAPIIPIEHFFDNPRIAGAQISPDGKWLSYLKPYKNKLNIHVRRVSATEASERRMTSDTIRPVTGYFWAADGTRLLYVQDKGGNENFHVYSVPVAGTGTPMARDLTPFDGVRAVIFAVPRNLPGKILIGLNKRTQSAFDPHWLDIESGELQPVGENPGRHGAYLIDKSHKVRLAAGQNMSGGLEIYARATESDPWRTVKSYSATENVNPIRFYPDGKRVYISSNAGDTDLGRLLLLDLETGAEEVIESDPKGEADFSGALFSDIDDSLLATVYVADTVRIYPKTQQMERDLGRIRKLHDGTPNLTSSSRDETKWIVSFNSPTDPGATYLYDRTTGRSKFLFRPRPWLVSRQLAHMKPVSFQSRDGLKIHGYLSTPRGGGVAAKNLPLVLLVHGGPWARDSWGYQSEAQLFANRGYSVLQVNYRGSTGYGKKFYNAAVKEFSGAMHNDLIDGVQWAIDEGIADPKKVAIYGGSYGGYATLVGLTFTPDVFACGVDYVGPSSLITLIQSFPAYWRPFFEGSWFRFVGDPEKEADREEMKKRSPLFLVDRIKAPLLIVQGANDPRVTKLEADQMAIALRDRGVKVRYLIAMNEGHGFQNSDNRMAFYRSMEQFLGECLGGRVQQKVSPAIDAHIRKLSVNVDTLKLAEKKEVSYIEIRPGDAAIDASRIAPTVDTVRLVVSAQGQQRETGLLIDHVRLTTVNAKPAIERVLTFQSPGGTFADTVVTARLTLMPMTVRRHNPQRSVSLDFDGAKLKGSLLPAGTGSAPQPMDATFDGAIFSNGSLDLALRSLPLRDGYAVKMPVYSEESKGMVWFTGQVTGSEIVHNRGVPTDSWFVDGALGGLKMKIWISKDSRVVTKTVLSPQPGVEIISSR